LRYRRRNLASQDRSRQPCVPPDPPLIEIHQDARSLGGALVFVAWLRENAGRERGLVGRASWLIISIASSF
jgi:hypothetical protein